MTSVWVEEFPGSYKRYDVPPGGLTVLHVPHNMEKSDMAKANTDTKAAKGGKAAAAKGGKAAAAKGGKAAAAKGGKAADKATDTKAKPGPKGSRFSAETLGKKIRILVKENPRRQNTKAFRMYELYKDGMTVEAFFKAGGGSGDIRWDVERKNIELY